MKNINFKAILPYGVCLLIFVAISFAYFAPDIFEGKVLFQGDTQQGIAIGHETEVYRQQSGEESRWTNSLFSGMPTYQSSPRYAARSVMRPIEAVYRLFLPNPVSYLYIMMVGFFILMLALHIKKPLAVLGSIMYAFSSYFFIIIEAGHIWKFTTLAYIPPTIAGIILVYQGRYWVGAALTAFFAALQIYSNHVQMTYYFLFAIAAIAIAFAVQRYKAGEMRNYLKATAILIGCAVIAVGVNVSNLYHTYQYAAETMRGGSELAAIENADVNTQLAKEKSEGLEKEYITQWSYGIGETLTLMIPNTKGGATAAMAENQSAMQKASPMYSQYIQQMNQYWGDQPFTSGPVYVGAFVMFLFILGLFIVKGPLKWALLAATIFSIIMSWGKNFMLPTEIFIDYFPLYNKFRAVSSILVVAEFCIPLLAVLALKNITETPDFFKIKGKEFGLSLLITAGTCLVMALMPGSLMDYLSQMESESYLPQAQKQPELMGLLDELIAIRQSIFSADAWRSFFIIIAGAAAIYLFSLKKISATVLVAAVTLLTLVDLWQVDKRYLNSQSFVAKRQISNPFVPTEADKEILKDTDPNFRVFNATTNTFNDAVTSYFHKSVGGYHAAKLQRYQDIIDRHLSERPNPAILNMLNTKYFITRGENKKPQAIHNPGALGNAWFAQKIMIVENAADEIEMIGKINPANTVVIDQRFQKLIAPEVHKNTEEGLASDSVQIGKITLTSYKPNELKYRSVSTMDALGVFSEVYYPGWKATIDGKDVEILRADYILRAINIPAGEHEIVFEFRPVSVKITDSISWICMIMILLMGVTAIVFRIKK